MPKFRHEINLLNGTLLTGQTSTERVIFDPTQYSGTITVYFEALGSVSTGSASATLSDGTNTWTVSFLAASYNLVRTGSMSISLTAPHTFSVAAGTNLTIKAARVIVFQDTGSSDLQQCETQIEIGSRSSVTAATIPTGATASNQQNPKYWFYDSTKWDGNTVFIFEAVFATPTSKSLATCQLQVADGSGNGFTNWANVANCTLTTTNQSGSQVPIRSAAFTPISGRWYRIVSSTPTTKSAMNVYCAKIIIRQTPPAPVALISQTLTNGAWSLAGQGGPNDVSIIAQGFTTGPSILVTSITLNLQKFLTPTDGLFVQITDARGGNQLGLSGVISGSSVTSSVGPFVFTFSPAVSLSAGTQYWFQIKRNAVYDGSTFYNVSKQDSDVYPGGQMSYYQGSTWSDTGWDVLFTITGYTGAGSQTFIAQTANNTSAQLYGYAGSNYTDTIAQSFTVGASDIILSVVRLAVSPNSFPTDSTYVDITSVQDGAILATSLRYPGANQDYAFSPTFRLLANAVYFINLRRTVADTLTNYSVGMSNGSSYPNGIVSVHSASTGWFGYGATMDLTFSIIGYAPGASATQPAITKLQPQYLILNTLVATGTALQKQMINWDPNDWNGVTNAYKLQVEAANASTSVMKLFTFDGVTLVATVTSPNNAGTGAATMP